MHTTPRDARRRLLCAAVVVTALAATGCHMENRDQPAPATESADALQELRSLPSLEDTKKQVQAAMAEITTEAQKLIPTISWQSMHGDLTDWCERPYQDTYGQRYFFPDQVAEQARVSEPDWAAISEVARQSAAKIGATHVGVMHDQPGNHDVWFTGPTGIFIKIAYQGNLVVSGYTGCRLP